MITLYVKKFKFINERELYVYILQYFI